MGKIKTKTRDKERERDRETKREREIERQREREIERQREREIETLGKNLAVNYELQGHDNRKVSPDFQTKVADQNLFLIGSGSDSFKPSYPDSNNTCYTQNCINSLFVT